MAAAAPHLQAHGQLQPNPAKAAIICLFDGSVNFADQWTFIAQYLSPLMGHIASMMALAAQSLPNPSPVPFKSPQDALSQTVIGIVTYGSADTRPNPLIKRQFFASPAIITAQLRDARELGLGRTWSGGKSGMATLEGLVAAIELFDLLFSGGITQKPPPPFCHILHFACNAPSKATRPMWNKLSALDNVSWETLPEELTKRDIYMNTVLTKPVPELENMHKKMGIRDLPSKFNVQPGHTILISGMVQPSPARFPVKTPSDVVAPAPPTPAQAQRPPVQSSPAPVPTNPSPAEQQPQQAPQTQTQEDKFKTAFQYLRALQLELQKEFLAIRTMNTPSQQQPLTDEQKQQQMQFKAKWDKAEKLRGMLNQPNHLGLLVRMGLVAPGATLDSPFPTRQQGQGQAPQQRPEPTSQSQDAPHPTPTPQVPSQPLGPAGFARPAEITDQLNKLMANNNNNNTPSTSIMPQPQPQPHRPNPSQTILWTGRMAWQGTDPVTKRLMEVTMMAEAGPIANDCRWRLWPQVLTLTPVKKQNPLDIQVTIKRLSAGVALFQASSSSEQPENSNSGRYQSLRQLLSSKSMTAVTTLNPDPENQHQLWDLVIFPMADKDNPNTGRLLGTILPHGLNQQISNTPDINLNPSSELTAQHLAMAQMLQQRQAQQAMSNRASAPGYMPMPQPMLNVNAFGGGGGQQQHRRTPSGSGFNMPVDAMQSFMQRSQESGGGPGA